MAWVGREKAFLKLTDHYGEVKRLDDAATVAGSRCFPTMPDIGFTVWAMPGVAATMSRMVCHSWVQWGRGKQSQPGGEIAVAAGKPPAGPASRESARSASRRLSMP